MITYKVMYKYLPEGIHAEVLDFPGAISFGKTIEEARKMISSALVDMAETVLSHGEPLPTPEPMSTNPDSDFEEPIHLLLSVSSRVEFLPQDAVI